MRGDAEDRPTTVVRGAPIGGADQGVVGARSTSTSRKTAATRARYQVRKRCAWTQSEAGSNAPARKRSRVRQQSRAPSRVDQISQPVAQQVEAEDGQHQSGNAMIVSVTRVTIRSVQPPK